MDGRPLDYHRFVGDVPFENLTSLFSKIVLHKLRCGSNLYSTVVGCTKMRAFYALKSLVEAN